VRSSILLQSVALGSAGSSLFTIFWEGSAGLLLASASQSRTILAEISSFKLPRLAFPFHIALFDGTSLSFLLEMVASVVGLAGAMVFYAIGRWGAMVASVDGGQTQSNRTKIPASIITDCSVPARGRSNHTDGPANQARQSTHGQRHQPPHKTKKGMQGQSTYNAHGRLVKAGSTFDRLLSKYASKKVVLCN
jgi:hypothetical protein